MNFPLQKISLPHRRDWKCQKGLGGEVKGPGNSRQAREGEDWFHDNILGCFFVCFHFGIKSSQLLQKKSSSLFSCLGLLQNSWKSLSANTQCSLLVFIPLSQCFQKAYTRQLRTRMQKGIAGFRMASPKFKLQNKAVHPPEILLSWCIKGAENY